MKAVVKYGFEQGETELREIEKPRVGPEDVLIHVKAAGLCGTDLALDDGKERWLLRPPVVLGHEFAGVIEEVGERVTDHRPGERVVSENTGYVCGHCAACNRGDYILCEKRLGLGYGMNGGFTDYVLVPGEILKKYPDCLYAIPDGMSYEEAAIMDPCSNAYRAVVQDANVQPGDDVVVFGVGAIGLFCIQWARICGAAKIICVGMSSDEMRFAAARKFGAHACIESDRTDVVSAVREQSESVPIVIDCVGKNIVLKQSMAIVQSGGRIIKVGMDDAPPDFSLDPIVKNGLTLIGHQGYDWDCWHNSLHLYESGALDFSTLITHRLPLSQYKEAFALARAQKAIKVILYPLGED